jgi:hypothetical protein
MCSCDTPGEAVRKMRLPKSPARIGESAKPQPEGGLCRKIVVVSLVIVKCCKTQGEKVKIWKD